jgi:hypothetical protein
MKLTNEQITAIEETLVLKGLIYDDIKLELTDHIASEIESKFENNQSNFKEVFDEVFSKWQGELKLTSNYWSSGFVAPKIVIDRYVLKLKNLFKFAVIYDLMFSFLMVTITKIYPQETAYSVLNFFFVAAYFLICLMLFSGRFYMTKSQSKTISEKVFRDSFLVCIMLFIYMTFFGRDYLYRHYSKDSIGINFLEWFMRSFYLFIGVYLIQIAFEHFKTVKKYMLSISKL